MVVDEKGKLFGKINILDLIIIAVVVLALVFGLLMFTRDKAASGTVRTVYTIEVLQEEPEYFDHIIVGEPVEDGQTRDPMGKIVDVEISPSEFVATNMTDGKFQIEELEGKYDGLISIELDAEVKYPDIIGGKEAIKIGKKLALRSSSAAMTGFVVAMDYDEQEMGRYEQ